MDRTQHVGTALFLALGLTLLGVSALLLRGKLAFLARAQPIQAVVLSFSESRNASGEPFYRAEVEWMAPDGQKRRSSISADRFGGYQPGKILHMLHDPQDPERPKSGDFLGMWLSVAIFGCIGLTFTFIAIRVAFRAWRAG